MLMCIEKYWGARGQGYLQPRAVLFITCYHSRLFNIHGRLVYYVSIYVATQCMYMNITQGCPICCTLLFYLYLYRHVYSPGLFHFCCTFVFMLSTHVFSLSHIINFTLVQCTGMVCTCIHICSRLVCHTLYYLCLL